MLSKGEAKRQRREIDKQRREMEKRMEREHLTNLRAQVKEARAARRERLAQVKAQCRRDREATRERILATRKAVALELKARIADERAGLLTDDARAVWGVIENWDRAGARRWRCAIFRNEGAGLSSTLILEATAATFTRWRSHYGSVPAVPLQTEVDAERTRRKRDPGRCFLRAGWRVVDERRGKFGPLVILQAPDGGSP